VITMNSLSSLKVKDLAQEAKKHGIVGWHSMRKEELIAELLKVAKRNARQAKSKSAPGKGTDRFAAAAPKAGAGKRTKSGVPAPAKSARMGSPSAASPAVSSPASTSGSKIARLLKEEREREENLKNLALIGHLDRENQVPASDRLVLVLRDPYWVQAYWEVTKSTVQRAKVALAGHWFSARPVLRLLEICNEGHTNATEELVEEIVIHGGVKNWFIHLKKPGHSYRVAIGYRSADGRFHLIAKSNQIHSPDRSAGFDENWTDITNDAEKYYALSGGFDDAIPSDDLQAVFEEKTRHPIHAPAFERLGSGINGHASEFEFQVDAHLIIFGTTQPNSSVSVAGEPVRIQRDGSFSLKMELPDRRQVLPIIASSRDGTQQRTTVIAVERNTKVMEPLTNDFEND
jgi:hypothetical protein